MYLENIFSAEDIQKQLPEENKKFIVVDKFWKDIMVKTFKRPLVYDCCASEELLRKFQKNPYRIPIEWQPDYSNPLIFIIGEKAKV